MPPACPKEEMAAATPALLAASNIGDAASLLLPLPDPELHTDSHSSLVPSDRLPREVDSAVGDDPR